MEHVTEENYVDMCQRVWNLESDDSVTGSSNFGKFIKLFESDDSGWIDKINRNLEEQMIKWLKIYLIKRYLMDIEWKV